ncbi:MAG: spore cortex-lytic enzyme [Firmicutes bacterium]|nr:spore cortex-lytic enzyme [Bacillota bacterium]
MKRKVILLVSIVTIIIFSSVALYSQIYLKPEETINKEEKTREVLTKAPISKVLYWGARGQDVIDVQSKLYRWGYYDGTVDGIYGAGTYRAVRRFQRKNGLTVDGIVGPKTAEALGLSFKTKTSNRSVSRNDNVYLLARAIHGESRGEPYIGKVAVAAVVLNRVEHPSFPNSIASVIYQPGAFTAVSDGQINLPPDDESVKAARDALNGWDPTYGCRYYWNPATATSRWIWSRKVVIKIGKHWFGN